MWDIDTGTGPIELTIAGDRWLAGAQCSGQPFNFLKSKLSTSVRGGPSLQLITDHALTLASNRIAALAGLARRLCA
jgi:hypothetical protein